MLQRKLCKKRSCVHVVPIVHIVQNIGALNNFNTLLLFVNDVHNDLTFHLHKQNEMMNKVHLDVIEYCNINRLKNLGKFKFQ